MFLHLYSWGLWPYDISLRVFSPDGDSAREVEGNVRDQVMDGSRQVP